MKPKLSKILIVVFSIISIFFAIKVISDISNHNRILLEMNSNIEMMNNVLINSSDNSECSNTLENAISLLKNYDIDYDEICVINDDVDYHICYDVSENIFYLANDKHSLTTYIEDDEILNDHSLNDNQKLLKYHCLYSDPDNVLFMKKLIATGTSITAGFGVEPNKTYSFLVAQNNNMRYVNDAKSGSTMSNNYYAYVNSEPDDFNTNFKQYSTKTRVGDDMVFKNLTEPIWLENNILVKTDNVTSRSFISDRMLNLPDDMDILTIEYGWNDYDWVKVGEIKDTCTINSYDLETYLGAYQYCIEYLIDKFPNTKIGLIVPYGTCAKMRQGVRDLANLYNLFLFDMTNDESIPCVGWREDSFDLSEEDSNYYKNLYLLDGIHPNELGHQVISNAYEKWLRSFFE